MKIVINLGTIDILHGRDLTDMCQDYTNLVKVCFQRNIQIVITTLAPIANRMHIDGDVHKLHDFNEWLINRFSGKHQVIDITDCMCEKNGKLWFDCYQG